MNNSFNAAFGCWPHKSFVIYENKLKYVEKIKAIDYKSITTKLLEFLSSE